MCFGSPKMPKVKPDLALLEQQRQARELALQERSESKRKRLADLLALQSGKFGRAMLLGRPGGAGFETVAGRSLFSPVEPAPATPNQVLY